VELVRKPVSLANPITLKILKESLKELDTGEQYDIIFVDEDTLQDGSVIAYHIFHTS
jgi:hypothetical protein